MPSSALLPGFLCASVAYAGVVAYEGNAFPEDCGFQRVGTFDVDRWVNHGWFGHYVERGNWEPLPYGEDDYYDFGLASFMGAPFFIEWRMISDAPDSEVDQQNGAAIVVLVGGPVTYHFNIASGLARILRGIQYPVQYFYIEPGVAHTYRLEVFGGDYFEFRIDNQIADSGEPEDVFPTRDALMSFGTGYYLAESSSVWDYVRFGVIPIDGSGDYDSDNDVDGRDFYFFHECLTNARAGINGGPDEDAGPGCRFADFDGDGDVDLRDLAAFQLNFTGGE